VVSGATLYVEWVGLLHAMKAALKVLLALAGGIAAFWTFVP
jgi:hypothetical protein